MRLFGTSSTSRRAPDFRTFFESLPTASLVLSQDLEIVAANDEYLRTTETRREQLVGRKLDLQFPRRHATVWIGDIRRLVMSLRRVLHTGKPYHFILRHKATENSRDTHAADAWPIWSLTNTPIYDDARNLTYVLHQAEDVGGRTGGTRRRQRLERRILGIQEDERTRIARELHDQTAQYLAAMMLGLEELKAKPAGIGLPKGIERLQELVSEMGHEMHRLTWNLRPAPIEELGFRNAIERLVEELLVRSSCEIHFFSNMAAELRFDPHVETACYRIIQEGLTNILRHSHAATASVVLSCHDRCLSVIIEDDGTGFDATSKADATEHDHIGLRGIRERLALVRGNLEIESTAGCGTSLFIRIPIGEAGASL